jgi:hypothetical protein
MLTATIVRVDNSIIMDETQIWIQPPNRGDGRIWRGTFTVPNLRRPTPGETVYLLLDDDRKVSAVVTDVDETLVHFQSPGLMPKPTAQ